MPPLPSGTVTFLFTDIEGSTRLWEQRADAMRDALARHDALLRATIEGYDGSVFKTVGDAFYAVFRTPAAALAASLAGQRALHAQDWGAVGQLRVRMALQTGTAAERDGDYFGPALNRVARLLGAGHGGQMLVSQATQLAAQDGLPQGASLRDLGEHRLKDLPRPERVYQLVALGLPQDFPPLRSADPLHAHYEAVGKALVEGRLVPFLGASVNLCGRPPDRRWHYGAADCLPSDRELARHLADSFGYPVQGGEDADDLVRVAQHAAVMAGPGPLYEELHTLLDWDYAPTPVHALVAALPAVLRRLGQHGGAPPRYPLIVTTTYDDALERAFAAAGEPYDLVAYAAEGDARGRFWHRTADGEVVLIERPNEYRGLALEERPVLLKLHGVVDRLDPERDSFVVTEDDYIDYLTRTDIANLLPVTLAAKLRRSHFLFLGYSLRHWHPRVILHRLWGQQRFNYKSWAVQLTPEPLDQELWRKRDVEILTIRLEDYVAALSERVHALAASVAPVGGAP